MSKGVDAIGEATNMKLVIAKASVSILMLPGVRTFLYMCVHTHTHTHTHMYMYMHICLSLFLLSSYIHFNWSLCYLPTGSGHHRTRFLD